MLLILPPAPSPGIDTFFQNMQPHFKPLDHHTTGPFPDLFICCYIGYTATLPQMVLVSTPKILRSASTTPHSSTTALQPGAVPSPCSSRHSYRGGRSTRNGITKGVQVSNSMQYAVCNMQYAVRINVHIHLCVWRRVWCHVYGMRVTAVLVVGGLSWSILLLEWSHAHGSWVHHYWSSRPGQTNDWPMTVVLEWI